MFVMANGNIKKVADHKVQPYDNNDEKSNLEILDKDNEEKNGCLLVI